MSEERAVSKADVTRSRLLEAAETAFASKGFHGTTTRDIASAAGMSPAVLYVHHNSKEELLYQLSRSGHDEALRVTLAALASSDDPVVQLRRFLYDFALHHARSHTMSRIANYELPALSEEHLAEVMVIRRAISRAVRDLIDRGVAAGVFVVPSPRMAVLALMSMSIDIARWYTDDVIDPEDIAAAYADMGVRMLGAH
jgi:AcrR family transcriptional regulator